MTIKPVETRKDHEAALARIEKLMDAKAGSMAGNELDVLVTLVEAYEEKHFLIESPDPHRRDPALNGSAGHGPQGS